MAQIPKRQLEQKYWQGRISKQQLHVQPHAAVKMAMVYVQFFFLLASVGYSVQKNK